MRIYLLLILLATAAVSCQPKSYFNSVDWSQGQGSSKAVENLKNIQTSVVQHTFVNSMQIETSVQTVNGFEVENSFIKRTSKNAETLQISARYLDANKIKNKNLNHFKTDVTPNFVQLKFLQLVSENEKIEVISVKPVLVTNSGEIKPRWRIEFFDRTGTPWAYFLDENYQLVEKRRVGSQFNSGETSALIYPSGPKQSGLTDVMLSRLKAVPITNDLAAVTSESPNKVGSVNQPLNFSIDDNRFDQVQVFYYIDKSLSWFRSTFNMPNLHGIEAVTNVGYPEKLNTAFFSQGRIRIGTGDGMTYDRIPKDPSIIMHESVHGVIEQVAGLPYEGQGGSLNEAFADFFTAVQLNNANLGEVAYLKGPFKRSLDIRTNLSESNDGLYHDSLIVSGLLWQLQKVLPPTKVIQFSFTTLTRLNPASDFKDFATKIKESATQTLTADEFKIFKAYFEQRGFL